MIFILLLYKFCELWKQDQSSNWSCKIIMWFTGAYIKNWCWKIFMWLTAAYIKKYFRQIDFQDIYFREFKEKRSKYIS